MVRRLLILDALCYWMESMHGFDELSRWDARMREGSPDPDLLRSLEAAAIAYAHFRARWALASREERLEMDPARTRSHNAFIDCCNILARSMRAAGVDASWRDQLGDDRKRIGDFACHIHYRLALAAR